MLPGWEAPHSSPSPEKSFHHRQTFDWINFPKRRRRLNVVWTRVFFFIFYCLGTRRNSRSVLALVIVSKLNRCDLTTKKRGLLRKDAAHIVQTRRSRHPDIHVSSDVSYTTCKQAYSQVFRVCALITLTRALPQLQLQRGGFCSRVEFHGKWLDRCHLGGTMLRPDITQIFISLVDDLVGIIRWNNF